MTIPSIRDILDTSIAKTCPIWISMWKGMESASLEHESCSSDCDLLSDRPKGTSPA